MCVYIYVFFMGKDRCLLQEKTGTNRQQDRRHCKECGRQLGVSRNQWGIVWIRRAHGH